MYARHKTLWSSSRPTYCYIYRPKALVNLHTAQDFVEQLKAYILLYISSKSTRKSTHGTRLCGAAQGLHIAIYIVQKHSSIYTRHKTLWSSSRPTYCYIYRPKALVNLHTAQDFVEQLKAYILLSSRASVGWSEPANIYFLSHDIRYVLYLVLSCGDIFSTDLCSFNHICVCSRVSAIANVCDRVFAEACVRSHRHSSSVLYFTSWCVGHVNSVRMQPPVSENISYLCVNSVHASVFAIITHRMQAYFV